VALATSGGQAAKVVSENPAHVSISKSSSGRSPRAPASKVFVSKAEAQK